MDPVAARMDVGMHVERGGSLDCGSGQTRPPIGTVNEIWVPAASATDTAYYDVWTTLAFQ